MKRLQPGCVIIQALAGVPGSLLHELGFVAETWLVSPTPDMKIISGTRAQWARLAEAANYKHTMKQTSH